MRFKASDLDLKDTDNWVTNCYIASGNEAGYFSIRMDPTTNEAVIMLDKVCNDICWIFIMSGIVMSRFIVIPKCQYSYQYWSDFTILNGNFDNTGKTIIIN